jgi:hypothetical protein
MQPVCDAHAFLPLHFGATCKPEKMEGGGKSLKGQEVINWYSKTNGEKCRKTKSAEVCGLKSNTLAIWQIRNHLAWGLQRERSIRVDGLGKCSTMGSQGAGDRRKFFDPFRSELCDYLLQAVMKLVALVSLVEVASRAHLYKDLVICGSTEN